jgi:NADPH-dependent ferric siderophore reductase
VEADGIRVRVGLRAHQPLEAGRPKSTRLSSMDRLWTGTISRCPVPGPYAWPAGESGAITDLRRQLVNERGIDKELVYFSGYWQPGSAIE